MMLLPSFSYLLPDFDKIQYKRYPRMLFSICKFQENRRKQRRTFRLGLNEFYRVVRQLRV